MSETRYELWDMVSYGAGEPPIPFTKLASDTEFYAIYYKFSEEIKTRPCVIIMNNIVPSEPSETNYEK